MFTSLPNPQTLVVANELILVDGLCPRIGELIPGALQELVALGHGGNPLRQITQELARRRRQGPPVDSLHLVAHGRPGGFQIGGQWVTAAALISQAEELAQWQVSTIALWSCEVGADHNFVALLEELTGSEVLSSEHTLGRTAQGANWELVSRSGAQLEIPFSETARQQSSVTLTQAPYIAPAAPFIISITDNVSPITGTITSGDSSNDTDLVLTGTAEAGSTVSIYNGSNTNPLGTTTANNNGDWSFIASALTDGTTYDFNATATDTANNTSSASSYYTVTVDTTAPGVTISGVSDFNNTPVNSGGTISAQDLVITGTAEAGSTVSLFDGSILLSNDPNYPINPDTNGVWSYNAYDLIDGKTYIFNATSTATDAAGNVSTPSSNYTVSVEFGPVNTSYLAFGYSENKIPGDLIASITSFQDGNNGVSGYQFAGRPPANGVSTSPDGYFQIDSSGHITITTAGCASGVAQNDFELTDPNGNIPNVYFYYIQGIDGAGYLSPRTYEAELTVTDIVDETAPVVTASQSFSYAENQAANASIASILATDSVGVTQFRFANSGGTPGQTSSDGYFQITNSGDITITSAGVAAGIAQNDYETSPNSFTYAIQAGDAAGNWSQAQNISLNVTDVNEVVADTNAPASPVITSATDDIPQLTGTITSGDSSNDTDLVLTGTAEAGSTVFIYNGSNTNPLGTTTADNNGDWSFIASALTDGTTYDFNATATDTANNTSSASSYYTVTVDTTAPAVSITTVTDLSTANSVSSGDTINDRHLIISGTAQAGSTVSLFDGSTPLGTATADNSGLWTYSAYSLTDGQTYVFNATSTATDAAGNVSTPSSNYMVSVDFGPVNTSPLVFSYSENQTPGSTIATITSFQDGNNGVAGYQFAGSPPTNGVSTSLDGYFQIDSLGQITITAAGCASEVAQNDFELTDPNAFPPNGFFYGIQAIDGGGNLSPYPSDLELTVIDVSDETAPVVTASQSFSYAENQTANAAVATVLATDAVGLTQFRFANSGGTPGQTSSDGYFQINNPGAITITSAGVAAGVAQNDYETSPNSFTYAIQAGDAAGNWSQAESISLNATDLNEVVQDITAPSLAITSDKSSLKIGETITITYAFSEDPGNTFTDQDITISGGTLSAVTGSNLTRTATFTPTSNSTTPASIAVASSTFSDTIGNQNTDGADDNNHLSLTVDTIAPTLAITSNKSSFKIGETATISFTFSEDPGESFSSADLSVLGGTLANLTDSGTTRTATFTPTSNSTTPASIAVASSTFSDTIGNQNTDGADDNNHLSLTVDTIAPTLTITSDKSSFKIGETATISFTFSEDPGESFSSADLSVLGGTLANLTDSGTTRTATFTPTQNTNGGTASITVTAGSYTDAASNSGGAGSSPSLSFDTALSSGPIDITSATDTGEDDTITAVGLPVVTFTGEPDFVLSLIGADGSTPLNQGTEYTVSYANGTYTVTFLDADPDPKTTGQQPFGTFLSDGSPTGNTDNLKDGTYTLLAMAAAGNSGTIGSIVIATKGRDNDGADDTFEFGNDANNDNIDDSLQRFVATFETSTKAVGAAKGEAASIVVKPMEQSSTVDPNTGGSLNAITSLIFRGLGGKAEAATGQTITGLQSFIKDNPDNINLPKGLIRSLPLRISRASG